MTRSGYAKHSGVTEVMGSFQSLHANRAARDPLPIFIVAVDMPCVLCFMPPRFLSDIFSKEWLAAF